MSAKTKTPVTSLPFSTMSDEEVSDSLKKYQINLKVDEARAISKMLGRDPTLVEMVIWGIQGSEHCSYKSSKRFLKNLPTEGPNVILGPSEDSGIVAITDEPKGKRWGLVMSHESHNHPSQIVPFEGAATGIGGVVRDVVCMGARVIGAMDLLRLGDLETEESKTIATEVVRGIAGYGNPLGIPNLGGDTVFDSAYNSNCLVNAIAFGIVREDEIIHSYVPKEAGEVGYDIIIVGKPTDRSGFGGASFASALMDEGEKEQNTGAVQEPNPFLERHLLASTYALFDWLVKAKKLDKVSFKDLGAGGVVCSTVEQVSDLGLGAEVDLGKVHTSIENLPPEIIACAETQERFCWMCHPDLTDHIIKHYNEDWDLPSVAENARASVIGKVTTGDIYKVTFNGKTVCEAKALDITCGLEYTRPTKPIEVEHNEPVIECEGPNIAVDTFKTTLTEVFKAMLAHPNHASKQPVIVHYDKNVIGNTLVEAGEADAGVITPLQDLESHVHVGSHPDWDLPKEKRLTGVAVAGDGNGRYGRISPYLQGFNAVVESIRNVASVGAKPRALTDCLNYGNPEMPEQLWQFEEGVRGIADAAKGLEVPVISGNVSFYNGKPDGSATYAERSRSIDPTAIVCCAGVIPDAKKAVTMQLKKSDSLLFLVGECKDECGGSAYFEVLEQMAGPPRDELLGMNVPQPNLDNVSKQIEFITEAIEQELILSSHDISEGGLILAAFEMTLPRRKIGGDIGLSFDIAEVSAKLRPDQALFSQTGGFLIEVDAANAEKLMSLALKTQVPLTQIGNTTPQHQFIIRNGKKILLDEDLKLLSEIWEIGLQKAIK